MPAAVVAEEQRPVVAVVLVVVVADDDVQMVVWHVVVVVADVAAIHLEVMIIACMDTKKCKNLRSGSRLWGLLDSGRGNFGDLWCLHNDFSFCVLWLGVFCL